MVHLSALLPSDPSARSLPPSDAFRTPPPSTAPALAFVGPLPASTAIHIALAHLDEQGSTGRVLILTQSGADWISALLRDGPGGHGARWMRDHAGKVAVLRRLESIDVRYAPTAQHLALLLSLLDASTSADTSPSPTRLRDGAPTLVILHEPSVYFGEDSTSKTADATSDTSETSSGEEATEWIAKPGALASHYGNLIALARSAVEALNSDRQADDGPPPTQLVILDSLAPTITLPVLPSQPMIARPKNSGGEEGRGVGRSRRELRLRLSEVLGGMTDWMATVERHLPSAGHDANMANDEDEDDSMGGMGSRRSAGALKPTHKLSFGDTTLWYRETTERVFSLTGEEGEHDEGGNDDEGDTPASRWVWCQADDGGGGDEDFLPFS